MPPPIPALPIGRFSPAPGLFVDRTENLVTITGAMELYGPEATTARAQAIQSAINTTWTQTFSDGFKVSSYIKVTYRAAGSRAGNATQIQAVKIAGPSHVSDLPGLHRTMTLNANETDAFTWTAAHEFGHILGLQDRYSEGIMSKIRGYNGGTRTTTVDPRYQFNLMAIHGGKLESQNLRDLALENEPSTFWVYDDDHVRDWVNAHPMADITGLSTASKLGAIKTLMGGWISDADVAAIAKICQSVTSATEADAIRRGVEVLDFTGVGQRTAVRLALAGMPRSAPPSLAGLLGPRVHTVVTGDSLSQLAINYYGDVNQWERIYKANKDLIGIDPSQISPGQPLTIP